MSEAVVAQQQELAGKYRSYPEYMNSGITRLGLIPSHWQPKKLKRMASIENGRDYKHVEATEGFPVIGSGGQFTWSEQYLYSGESVLLGRKGTVDKPLYINGSFWTVDTMFYTKVGKAIPAKFLYYAALTIEFGLYSTNTALPSMTQEDLGNIHFGSPSYGEAENIAAFLDYETARIDRLIAKQQQLIELLKEKRQAVISHAVTKGLNPDVPMKDSGIEWLGQVPEHWVVSRIKNYAKIESGHTPSRQVAEYWIDCDIPWVSLNDSKTLKVADYISDTFYQINELGMANSSAHLLPERVVVFTRDASIGLAAITTKPMAVSQHLIAWICNKEKVIPEYLLLIFYAMELEFERYTFGATIKTIGMDDVRSLTAVFPKIDEQKEINTWAFRKLDIIKNALQKAEDTISLLQERRTALISAAVTGKIDLRGWTPPVEEVAA